MNTRSYLAHALTTALTDGRSDAALEAIAAAFDLVQLEEASYGHKGVTVHLRTERQYWTEYASTAAKALKLALEASTYDGAHLDRTFEAWNGI